MGLSALYFLTDMEVTDMKVQHEDPGILVYKGPNRGTNYEEE
jgi:hypothetical protein